MKGELLSFHKKAKYYLLLKLAALNNPAGEPSYDGIIFIYIYI